MEQNYSGEIIVTKNLFLKVADSEFLHFTKMDMYSTVADVFAEGEADIIRGAAEKLKEGDYSEVLHLRRADGVYCPVLAIFHTAEEEGETLTWIELTELSRILSSKSLYAAQERISDTYFELLSSIMLKYKCESGHLDIFYVSDSRRRLIFSGTLEEWREMLLSGEKVEKEYIDEFEKLCEDVVTAKKSFMHTVKIRGFIGSGESDLCSFNCRSVQAPDDNVYVVGCIEAGSSEKMKSLVIDPVNDKDSFLDMLNKRAIIEHAKRILTLATIKRSFFIILDLDNFKSVNDVYGHKAGDAVLTNVTRIINENLGKRGVVGRIGGDEILIITDTIDEQTELRNMLRSIRTAVEWAYNSEPHLYNVTCSIGVSTYPDNGKDFDTLFELADKMLYIAKGKGKNRYIVYTPELHDPLLNKSAEPAAASSAPSKDFTNDKIGIMHRLVDNYLIRHSYNNEKIFSEVGQGFGLSEILILYDNYTVLFRWSPTEGVTTNLSAVKFFTPDSSFGELFDKDKLLVLDGLYKLEGKFPDVEKAMSEKGIKSALLYRLDRTGNYSGYVMFARDKQRQMWSDYEIMVLSLAAKVFELAMRE